jgi:RNA polymerase sigma-70 factor (ECF subfamily)
MIEQEKVWIEQIQKGDLEAFRKLMVRYQERLYALIYDFVGNPQDAEDVLQESFVKIFFGLKHFRGESSLATWMYRITVNACLDFLRGQKKGKRMVDWETHRQDAEIRT